MSTTSERYDLIVIGGGIHGVGVALESARRGLRPLLLERDEFGGATSANSQRIIHGGLRYLQSLALKRALESAGEQRWFLRTFPDLVKPLTCLMPLYGDGLRTPWAFAAAITAYGLLSRNRPAGRVLSVAETCQMFPPVRRDGLKGAGLWHDAVMVNSLKLLAELLRWAVACGAAAQSRSPVERLLVDAGRTRGVEAGGRQYLADVVVNCAGPWCRELATTLDRDIPRLLHKKLEFCVLLDRAPLSSAALAVSRRGSGARTYFLVPWNNKTLAGTHQAAWHGPVDHPVPTDAQVQELLEEVNAAVPSLNATREQIVHVFSGILPATKSGSSNTASRPVVIEHARGGGPAGLWSVSGVKYTTARLVGEQLIHRVFGHRTYQPDSNRPAASGRGHLASNEAEAALQGASEA